MIPDGTDNKDFKGMFRPGREMKSSPLPLALCVHQPGDLPARLTGNSRCMQEGPISKYSEIPYSKGPKKEAEALICNRKTVSNCFAESIPLQ